MAYIVQRFAKFLLKKNYFVNSTDIIREQIHFPPDQFFNYVIMTIM